GLAAGAPGGTFRRRAARGPAREPRVPGPYAGLGRGAREEGSSVEQRGDPGRHEEAHRPGQDLDRAGGRFREDERSGAVKFRTKQIHAGVEPDPVTGSILTPIYQTTTYVQPSVDKYLSKGYSYSRSGNPTVRALENKVAALEGGADCCAFSTGMAAINATLMGFLNAGDHAVVSDVASGGTYRICTKIYARFRG